MVIMRFGFGVAFIWLMITAILGPLAYADVPAMPTYEIEQHLLRLDTNAPSDLEAAIQSDQWQATDDFGVHGYDSGIYWLKANIRSTINAPQSFILRAAYPLHDRITFFVFDDDQLTQEWAMGDVLPNPNWQFPDKNFAIPLELSPFQAREILIRIEGMNSKMLKMEIITPDELQETIHWNRLIFGAIYGIMLAMGIYNLIIGFFVRDKAYIIYACQVAFFCLFIMAINGDGRYYLWLDYPEFNYYAIQVLGILYVFFLILFPWYLLKLNKYLPKAKYLFYFFWSVEAIFVGAVVFLPYEKSMLVAIAISALFSPVLFLSGLYFVFRRVPVAGIYTFAWSFYLFGATLVGLAASNVVELNIFTLNGGAIGGIIEQVLLSIALAKRIDNERKEKYTALKQATASDLEATRQKENYQKLYQRSPIGIVTIDEKGHVLGMNPKCIELFEIDSTDDILGYNPEFHTRFEHHKYISQSARKEGVLLDYETTFTTYKGNQKYCAVTLIKQVDDEQILYECYITDISERKRDQEVIHAMEEERMKTLEQLVTGMAHEINTPVGTSLTSTSYLKESLDNINEGFHSGTITKNGFSEYISSADQGLDIINKCLLKMKVLIQRFKQVSFRNIEQEKRELDLNEHIEAIFQHALTDDTIKHAVTIRGESRITTLPDLFEIILNQLIENSVIHAFRFHDSGQIQVLIEHSDNHIRLEYRDNGQGVKEEIKAHIFNPFVTSDRGNDDHAGLGLYRIHNMVTQALKGQVELLDEPGFGLRIEFDL